jgi:hypothetical protein
VVRLAGMEAAVLSADAGRLQQMECSRSVRESFASEYQLEQFRQ